MTRGNRMSPSNTAVVGLRPAPHMVAGRHSPDDEGAVFSWIVLNSQAIVAYWEENIGTAQLVQQLQPLPSVP
jgi:hypothetical protein